MPVAIVNGVTINYHLIGKGTPLVLIEGLGADHNSWIHQIPDLQAHFSLLLFDNRGIGKSTGAFGRYTISLMADDLAALLDHLHIEKAHIMGSSMGGMIAQEFASRYPERVNKLILCATFAKHPEMRTMIIEGIRQVLKGTSDDCIELQPHHVLLEKVATYFFKQVFSESFLLENKIFIGQTIQRDLMNPLHGETFLKQLDAIAHHDTTQKLQDIMAETLVITGDSDRLVMPSCSDYLASHIPHAQLNVVEDGTHGLHIEKPTLFNKIILDFLLDKQDGNVIH